MCKYMGGWTLDALHAVPTEYYEDIIKMITEENARAENT